VTLKFFHADGIFSVSHPIQRYIQHQQWQWTNDIQFTTRWHSSKRTQEAKGKGRVCEHASRLKGEVTKKTSRRLSSKESSSSPYKWRFTTHNPTPCWRLLDFLRHIMSTGILSNVEQCDTSRVENMVPYENADWLHRNDSYNMPHATNTSLQVLGTAYNCPVNIILYICYFVKRICYICCNTMNFISTSHVFQFSLIDIFTIMLNWLVVISIDIHWSMLDLSSTSNCI